MRGMTQEAFAFEVGVTQATVSRWERGVEFPNLSVQGKLNGMIGISDNSIVDFIKNYPGVAVAIDADCFSVEISDFTDKLQRDSVDGPRLLNIDTRRVWDEGDWAFSDACGGFNQIFRQEMSGVYGRRDLFTKEAKLATTSFAKVDGTSLLISTHTAIPEEYLRALQGDPDAKS